MYALSKSIHYPNYAHDVPNVSTWLYILGNILGRIFWFFYSGPTFRRAYIPDFMVFINFLNLRILVDSRK